MTQFGQDYHGAINFQRQLIKGHKKGNTVAVMLKTWKKDGKDAKGTIEAIAKSGITPSIEVHLAPFDKTHRYEISKFGKQVKEDAKWLESIARKYPHIEWLNSPFCENNHPRKVLEPFFNELRKIAPSCPIVNTIWKGDEVPGTITEVHIENSRSKWWKQKPKNPDYIVTFDGCGGKGEGDYQDTNVQELIQNHPTARQIRGWIFRYNGKFSHKTEKGNERDNALPPEKRKHWPSELDVAGANELLRPRDGSATWGKGELYKPFADDHGEALKVGASRTKDNKAMIILPRHEGDVVICDTNGKKICTLTRAPTDHTGDPKGPRYYAKLYAVEIARQARKNTGNSQIIVKYGKKKMPPTDGGMRSGKFK